MGRNAKKHSKVVVRKSSLTEDLYLTRKCTWTRKWTSAARYSTQTAAEKAAERCDVDDFGLFPVSRHPMRP